MDKDTVEYNLKHIEDMVVDQEKCVTYIDLSKALLIHVNDSKTLLKMFIDRYREKESNTVINVNYLISGIVKDNKANTLVCSEEDVLHQKQSMKSIFFEHVYSINKGPLNVDKSNFTLINTFADFQLCVGLIKGKGCIKHSLSELKDCKTYSHESSLRKLLVKSDNNVKLNSAKDSGEIVKSKNTETTKPKTHPVETGKLLIDKISPKKNAVSISEPSNKTSKGIAQFFNKQNGQTKKKDVKTNSPENDTMKNINFKTKSNLHEQNSMPNMNYQNKTNEASGVSKENKIESNRKDASNNSKSKNKSTTSNGIKKNAKVDKKRKRVLKVSDSESDEDKNDPFVLEDNGKENIDSEDEIPATPTVHTVKVTSGITNPKKRRKFVDKTFTDEDGYILTKKEEIYESCSDNEETSDIKDPRNISIEIKKPVSPNEVNGKESKKLKKKALSMQKGKQSTMMNYFKKAP